MTTPFGATSGGTIIQSGAQLNVNGLALTNLEPLTISGPGLTAAPTGALTNLSATAATWVGPITVGAVALPWARISWAAASRCRQPRRSTSAATR